MISFIHLKVVYVAIGRSQLAKGGEGKGVQQHQFLLTSQPVTDPGACKGEGAGACLPLLSSTGNWGGKMD